MDQDKVRFHIGLNGAFFLFNMIIFMYGRPTPFTLVFLCLHTLLLFYWTGKLEDKSED